MGLRFSYPNILGRILFSDKLGDDSAVKFELEVTVNGADDVLDPCAASDRMISV